MSTVTLFPMSGCLDTHPAFRSVVSTVKNADDIEELIGEALMYQHMFEKRTSPWEMHTWDYDELQSFVVDLKKVDRLYYIFSFDDEVSSRSYEILVRMDHNNEQVFVQLSAGCDFTGFDCQGGGEIYITKSPNILLKSIISENHNPSLIYRSLLEDGYRVEEPTQFELSPQQSWNNTPMLKLLSHQAIHDHRDTLKHYPEVLPSMLTNSVTEYIQAQETRYHHDELVAY